VIEWRFELKFELSQEHVAWDRTSQRLIAHTHRVSYESLSDEVVYQTKRRLIDTFASALGAWEEPVSQMACKIASRSRSDQMARVWGTHTMTTPELAAFANGVMTRSLDVSDTYLGKSRGHPSDMTSGLIAVAESIGADGKLLIAATSIAYDVYCSFCDVMDVNAKGWDQPVYSVIGCVLGIAKLMQLTPDQTGHALSLALTSNMALAQARRGHLSSWKGCAGANASRNAVFAAQLAQDGFTGPTAVFEGVGGLWQAIGEFDWVLPESPMIVKTHTKSLPVCYHGQSAVLAAFELRDRFQCSDISAIHVESYKTAVLMMGSDTSRWTPTTRETADHSLPYCVAIALLDGEITGHSFSNDRLVDPAVISLMKKVTVTEDVDLSNWYPDGAPGRVSITLHNGEVLTSEIRYPKGHEKSPMSDVEIEAKFIGMASHTLGRQQTVQALSQLWKIEQVSNVASIIDLFKPHE